MRIEALLPPSGREKLWQLRLEDGTHISVGEEEVLDFSLHIDMELDDEILARLQLAAGRARLRQKAMSMLLRRPYSKGELATRLLQSRDAVPEVVDEICAWAERIGLLNEESYAAMIVRRYQERGYGLYKIKSELYRHKIPKELWDAALSDMQSNEAAIDRYLERRLKSSEPRDIKKAADALARRGFSWSEISDGIRRFGLPRDEDYGD